MGLFGNKKHSIGKTIAELRKEKGWTQIELAEKLQVSDKAISKWEKDNGAPSVEFFPALAELFGVSIDYIMTGKIPEPEVVTISKAELCAKKDEVTLLEGIDCKFKDEKGKSIIDYILQYKSYKVFVALCEKKGITNFNMLDAIKFSIITNRLDLLRGQEFSVGKNYYPRWKFETEKELLMLLPKEVEKNFNDPKVKDECILTNDIFETIVRDKRINEQTLDILLGNQSDRKCVWYHVFPYLIHQSYLNNEDAMLNRLLNLSVENNSYAYTHMKLVHDSYNGGYNYVPNFFFIAERYGKRGHGLVRVLEETIKLALDRGDFVNFEKFNAINTAIIKYYDFKPYIATEYEIKMAKLKVDKTVSKEELTIQSTIHDGVVKIDELLATKDIKLIKKVLEHYPIHHIEAQYKLYQNKEWRKLFEYAVDNNCGSIANDIVKSDFDKISNDLVEIFRKDLTFGHNGSPIIKGKSIEVRNKKLGKYHYGSGYCELTIEEIIEYISAYKQQVISDTSYELDKVKTIGDLTKEYFDAELAKGNAEMVIVKLCVRLEAILRSPYHYEGDFSEMLNQYCNAHGQEDDGCGYNQEAKFVGYLQKLRKCRNSIVHSEKTQEKLSIDEIRYCIDYICNMK